MGLLYNATKWLDHVTEYPMRRRITENDDGTVDVVRAEGDIIQQGTASNAKNYNNMETGILANSIYGAFLVQQILQLMRSDEETKGEYGTVTIANTSNYPFTSPSTTVSISEKRSNLNYTVNVEVQQADGNVERIDVFDKQLNGFKIAFKGSARNVTFSYKIVGGKY